MTSSDLEIFLTTGVFAFMIAFVRIGTAMMMMPGIGNTFVTPQVRLLFTAAFAFVLTPVLQSRVPNPLPGMPLFVLIVIMEFVFGFFIGTMARVFMAALDTAGMVISSQSSLANAQLFNPAFASQGSIIGTVMTLTGTLLLFSTDLHHLLLLGMVESYDIFPIGSVPDTGSIAKLLSDAVGESFAVGMTISAPFLVVIFIMYVAMGVLSRLMPQVQIFMVTVPVQITLSLVIFIMTISAMMLYWLQQYEQGMELFLRSFGPPTSMSAGAPH